MSKINIQGILNGLRNKGNAYTPVIEAVGNAIYSLEKSTQGNGIVIIRLKRDSCLNYKDGEYPKVIGFEIEDNGIGFNQINRDYFDTLYTDHKIKDNHGS